MRAYIFILLMFILTANNSWASEEGLRKNCEAQLDKRFSQWRIAWVNNEVAEFFKTKNKSPAEIYGNFDGNAFKDIALLIQSGPNPKNDDPERNDSLHIAICLNNPSYVKLHVIDKPYCGDCIQIASKGQKYYDFETGKTGKYTLDGVSAICFERAGATYIYNGTSFTKVVDSD